MSQDIEVLSDSDRIQSYTNSKTLLYQYNWYLDDKFHK